MYLFFHETLISNFYYALLRITCAISLPSSTSDCSCRMSHKLSYALIQWLNMVDTNFKEAKGHWMNFNIQILPVVHTKLSSFFCYLKSTFSFSLHLFLLAYLFVHFNIIQFGKRIRYMKTITQWHLSILPSINFASYNTCIVSTLGTLKTNEHINSLTLI